MRYADGTLIGDLNDNVSATTTGSITTYTTSSINENQTNYSLLPVVVNQPPIIIKSMVEGSIPAIQAYPPKHRDPSTQDIGSTVLYRNSDGTVKVVVGASFTLRVEASQPSTLNIENGIPRVIAPNTGLTYAWLKDNSPLQTSGMDSLDMRVDVLDNAITITNIQPLLAGDYVCEITNDIGTTVSETITIEVYDPNIDDYFFTNLIRNPNGEQSTSEWQSTSTDFATDTFSTIKSQEFLKPNNVDIFGYTADMMNPRPYQISPGIVKGIDYVKDFVSNPKPAFFTRTRYKFDTKGGTFLVRAYQDVDVTDVQNFIRGGVYGISGVRAFFSCYIGSALSGYIPTRDQIHGRSYTSNKSYLMERPRISPENFVYAGTPNDFYEQTYVTIEELDGSSRVPSTILNTDNTTTISTNAIKLIDPWTKRYNQYMGRQYYSGIGSLTSNGETALNYFNDPLNSISGSLGTGVDAILFAAEELYPDKYERFTYGQYIEFNRLVLSKINDKTSKIRIAINFETTDPRMYDFKWNEALDQSDEVFEFSRFQEASKKNAWTTEGNVVEYLRTEKYNAGKQLKDFLKLANNPRGMATGLNLSLIPILTTDSAITDYYTATTLVQNEAPRVIVPHGLAY